MRPSSSAEAPSPEDWDDALARALSDPAQPRLVFQPIVDLSRGVIAGYEALSRFAGPPVAPPYVWFDQAERQGRSVELELRAVEQALAVRTSLPPDTFLSVNVTPTTLLHPAARRLLASESELHRLVFEVTEHAEVTDYVALRQAADRVREAGGLLAVDDAGAGYASLKHVLELRPNFVKLDRELVTGVDTDPTKRSVVQMLGELTDRIDAWLIAEGIETLGELDALLELDVPLGQGWALGMPEPPWLPLAEPLVEHLHVRHRERSDADRVATLLDRRPALPHGVELDAARGWFADHAASMVVQLDAGGRPAGLLRRADVEAGELRRHPVLSVHPDDDLTHVARRAMNRSEDHRFDPIACRSSAGAYVGLVTLERLVEWLARDERSG